MPGSVVVATWTDLDSAAPDLATAGRTLLLNCAAEWGIALLGTLRADGSPRIGPLCVYILDGKLYVTVEGHKERDLLRDERYFLHSYWGEGQDEFAVSGRAWPPIDARRRDELVVLTPRIRHSPVIRELSIESAHSVTYKNFPRPDMYADVVVWRVGEPARRWQRADGAPPEDRLSAATEP